MGRIDEIFLPNPSWWVKKNQTQFTCIGLGRVEPMGLTIFLLLLLLN